MRGNFTGKVDRTLSPRTDVSYKQFEDAYFEKRVWMPSANVANFLLMFTRCSIGGRSKLGSESFSNLIVTLSESEFVPRTLVFWNTAVKACMEGSPLIPAITRIERAGVKVLVSGFALERLGLKGQLRVGKLANTIDLLEAINKAQKIVTF